VDGDIKCASVGGTVGVTIVTPDWQWCPTLCDHDFVDLWAYTPATPVTEQVMKATAGGASKKWIDAYLSIARSEPETSKWFTSPMKYLALRRSASLREIDIMRRQVRKMERELMERAASGGLISEAPLVRPSASSASVPSTTDDRPADPVADLEETLYSSPWREHLVLETFLAATSDAEVAALTVQCLAYVREHSPGDVPADPFDSDSHPDAGRAGDSSLLPLLEGDEVIGFIHRPTGVNVPLSEMVFRLQERMYFEGGGQTRLHDITPPDVFERAYQLTDGKIIDPLAILRAIDLKTQPSVSNARGLWLS
jgi:hypothetical protein